VAAKKKRVKWKAAAQKVPAYIELQYDGKEFYRCRITLDHIGTGWLLSLKWERAVAYALEEVSRNLLKRANAP
jgi:hypothetical protein